MWLPGGAGRLGDSAFLLYTKRGGSFSTWRFSESKKLAFESSFPHYSFEAKLYETFLRLLSQLLLLVILQFIHCQCHPQGVENFFPGITGKLNQKVGYLSFVCPGISGVLCRFVRDLNFGSCYKHI